MAKWYFKIYDWMIEDLHLKGAELLVFAYLYSWIENDKDCTETSDDIIKKLGISRGIYFAAHKSIVQKLYLECKNCTYKVQKLHSKECKKCTQKVQKLDSKSTKIGLGESKNCTHKVQKLDSTIYNNTTTINTTGGNARAHTREGEAEVITLKDVILTEWMNHYQRSNGTSYIPDFRETTTDTELIADAIKVKMAECGKDADSTDEQREFCAALFDAMYGVADNWQRGNWTLHTIATQFNRLFNQIRNGQRTDNNGGRSSDAAFRASIARYLTGAE